MNHASHLASLKLFGGQLPPRPPGAPNELEPWKINTKCRTGNLFFFFFFFFFYKFKKKNTTTPNIQIQLSVSLTAEKDSKSSCLCYERHLQ